MNEKLYNVIELVLSIILITFGVLVTSFVDEVQNILPYLMMGFITVKILLIFFKDITFKINKALTIVEILLNLSIVGCLIFFKNVDALSFVVSASVAVDFVMNIVRSIVYRKSDNEYLKLSFLGMENVIYLIFFVMLMFNKDSTLIATGVLFGTIILYKGAAFLLNNGYIRKLFNLSSMGRAISTVHGIDVLFGLIIIVILASTIFPYIEPQIATTSDALWYCFMLITTIGTGDYVAVTDIGRILSVVIGLYGIILVSLLTSSIVVYLTNITKKERK